MGNKTPVKLLITTDLPVFQHGGKKAEKNKERKLEIENTLRQTYHLVKGKPVFTRQDKLWARVFYFNHRLSSDTPDLHNIIKPLFDIFEGYVYKSDKQVIYFEGTRLEMRASHSWFEVEWNPVITDLNQALTRTCCWIEIDQLPFITPPDVKVTWIETKQNVFL
jgi:Holliday junction resolvase RusA-like endonuclease